MNANITLVTGYFDINRTNWNAYSRSENSYFENAKRVFTISHPIIIFIDKKYFDLIRQYRNQYEEKYTILIDCKLEDLKYYSLQNNIQTIMNSQDYKNGLNDLTVPEVWNPNYNIIMWSKLDLVMRAINMNPFNTKHFGWIDFGTHTNMLPDCFLNKSIVNSPIEDKIRFLCRSLPQRSDLDIKTFFKSHCNRFAGTFFTGSIENFTFFYNEQDKLIKEALTLNVVDCDQSLFAVIYLRFPDKFKLYFGDWNDLINKYNIKNIKIGFLSAKLTLRGTEINLYNYAHYNETILGNKSIIITRPYDYVLQWSSQDVSNLAYKKFNDRFNVQYYIYPSDVEIIIQRNNIDILFIEEIDNISKDLIFNSCKTIIHTVFDTLNPRGDLYAPVSEALNITNNTNYPDLPNIIDVFDTDENLKNSLNIPENAIVFGCYGGPIEYTQPEVLQAVSNIVLDPCFNHIYFIYMNINPFGPVSNRLIFLPGSANMKYKRMFINTCNAMLYGRFRGETFGLACGEFAICNKPIIARSGLFDNAHELILGDHLIKFTTYIQLYKILTTWPKYNIDMTNNGYYQYLPHKVMNLFKKYLDQL
jgi:protein YibB